MAQTANILNSLVSITQFNRGQASRIFDRLRTEPAAVILSPEEYTRLTEAEEDYQLLLLARERLAGDNLQNAIPEQDVLSGLGITEEEIAQAEDVELE